MNYELGLRRLNTQLSQINKEDHLIFLTLEARLKDYLDNERKLGIERSDKYRVVQELNDLAIRTITTSFNTLCSPEFPLSMKNLVLHNLPQRDYAEFIGRDKEVNDLLKELHGHHGRWPVIIVHGIGGSGKTTLALEVAWRLVLHYQTLAQNERFDSIVWLTAKENVLTTIGIRPRTIQFRGIEDIFDKIVETLDQHTLTTLDIQEKENAIRRLLNTQRTLLILDNLETVEDQNIENFLRDLVSPTKVLITSRHKLGYLPGLIYQLAGMTDEECLKLIERECIKESQNRVSLSSRQSEDICMLTMGMPLAIVWSIGLIRDGRAVEIVLEQLKKPNTDIVRFCFDFSMSIVCSDNNAHHCLITLCLFQSEVSRLTLGIITELEQYELNEALSKLETLSMITRQENRYSILPLVRTYLIEEVQNHISLQKSIVNKWQLDRDREIRLIDKLIFDAVDALQGNFDSDFRDACHQLVLTLCRALGIRILEDTPFQSDNLLGFLIETKSIFPGFGSLERIPLVFLKDISDKDRIINEFRNFVDYRLVFLISLFEGEELEDLRVILEPHAFEVIIFTHDKILHLVATNTPRQFLLSKVRLSPIVPYRITGPIPLGGVFVGRTKELQEIVRHIAEHSYAILGGCRTGKSSLLFQLCQFYLPKHKLYSIYHMCPTTMTFEDFLLAPINWTPQPPPNAPTTFGKLLKSPPMEKPVVILLDEVDTLIPNDRKNNWKLFNKLQGAANSGHCQFVFAGMSIFREALREPGCPLSRFVDAGEQQFFLSGLEYRAVEELVLHPMRQVGITFADEDAVVRRIYEITSGHPNIVQRLCQHLVQRLDDSNTRCVSLDDINTTTAEASFQEKDFLEVYWGGTMPLERLVTLLMAMDATSRDLESIQIALEKYGLRARVQEIANALENLTQVRSILRRTTTGYDFAIPTFPDIISSMDTDFLLEKFREEYLISKPIPYQVGTSLSANSPVYIERSSDDELLQLIQNNMSYVTIIGPRQTGKTSLIHRLFAKLADLQYLTVYVNFRNLSQENESAWYQSIFEQFSEQLARYGLEIQKFPYSAEGWRKYLEYLAEILMRDAKLLIIAFDELRNIKETSGEWIASFFELLREVFNLREISPQYRQITFLLAGTFSPQDLIQDSNISPFNIAYWVHLPDFTLSQVSKLVSFLALSGSQTTQIAERIFHWTTGQPYLTQLVCLFLMSEKDFSVNGVDTQIQAVLEEENTHFSRIIESLKENPELTTYLQSTISGKKTRYIPSVHKFQNQLTLLGVLRADSDGFCAIRNRMYEIPLQEFLTGLPSEWSQIFDMLAEHFSEEALIGLSFAYNIDYKTLPGSNKQERLQALVKLFHERRLLGTLSQQLQSMQE